MNTHIFIHTVTGPEHLLTFYSLWMCHLYQFFFRKSGFPFLPESESGTLARLGLKLSWEKVDEAMGFTMHRSVVMLFLVSTCFFVCLIVLERVNMF